MTDHELLLAISDIVEKKIKAEIEPLKADMKVMETSIRQDMKTMETSIRQDMKAMETSIRQDMKAMENRLDQRISNLEMHVEQVTDKNIQLLAEVCAPAAKRYEKATAQIESIQADVEIMKSVIKEHSEKLQMIS